MQAVFYLTRRKEREGRAPSRPAVGCRVSPVVREGACPHAPQNGRDKARPSLRLLSNAEAQRCGGKSGEGRAPSRPSGACRMSGVACRAGGRVSPRAAWERTRRNASPYPCFCFSGNLFVRFARASIRGAKTIPLPRRWAFLVLNYAFSTFLNSPSV